MPDMNNAWIFIGQSSFRQLLSGLILAFGLLQAQEVQGPRLVAHLDLEALRGAGLLHPLANCWLKIAGEVDPVLNSPVKAKDFQACWQLCDGLDLGWGSGRKDQWLASFSYPEAKASNLPQLPSEFRQVAGRIQVGDSETVMNEMGIQSGGSLAPIQVKLDGAAICRLRDDPPYRSLDRLLYPGSIRILAKPVPDGTEEDIRISGGVLGLAPMDKEALTYLPRNAIYVLALGLDGRSTVERMGALAEDPIFKILESIVQRESPSSSSLTDLLKRLKGTVVVSLVPGALFPGWCIDIPEDEHWREIVLNPLLRQGFTSDPTFMRYTKSVTEPFPMNITVDLRDRHWRITSEPTLVDESQGPIPDWAAQWPGHHLGVRIDGQALLRFALGLPNPSTRVRQILGKGLQAFQESPLAQGQLLADSSPDEWTCSGHNGWLACMGLALNLEVVRMSLRHAIHEFQSGESLSSLKKAMVDPQPRVLYHDGPILGKEILRDQPWAVISGKVDGGPDLPMALVNPELGLGCAVWLDGSGMHNHSDGDRGQQLWVEMLKLSALGRKPTADDWAPIMRERRQRRFGSPIIVHKNNFEMAAMPEGWSRVEEKDFNRPEWNAAWNSPDRKTPVIIIGETIAVDDAVVRERVITAIKAQMMRAIPEAKLEQLEVGVDGRAALRLLARGLINGVPQMNGRFILFHRGWLWQIIATSTKESRIPANEALDRAVERFGIRDHALDSPGKMALSTTNVVVSRELPCELSLAGTGWRVLEDPATVNEAASVVLIHPGTSTWAGLFAADLGGRVCSERAMLAGMLAQINQPFDIAVAGGERTLTMLDAPATEVSFTRAKNPLTNMVVRTVKVGDVALGVFLWRIGQETPMDAIGQELINGIHASTGKTKPRNLPTSTFENAVADWYVGKSLSKEAWPWAEAHALTHSGNSESVGRALRILAQQEQWTTALAWFEANARRLMADDLAIASWEPWLLFKCGKVPEAMTLYGQLFDRGWSSAEDFYLYVETRYGRGEKSAAFEAFTRWPKLGKTIQGIRQRAKMLHQEAKDDEAHQWLAGLAGSGQEADRLDQCDGLIAMEGFHEAKGLLVELVRTHPGSKRGWRLLGIAEYRLGWHRDAVQRFERALEIDSADNDLIEWRNAARQALGRGDNGALKREIPPVPIPDGRVAVAAPGPGADAVGARWLLFEDRIAWRDEADLDHTRHRVIHLADQAACADFATLEIPVDTEAESLYVNELWVTTPDGVRRTTLNREDCYLIDVPDSIAGSQRLARIPAAGLIPGCILEWTYTTRKSRARQFWLEITVPTRQACDRIQVSFAGDLGKAAFAPRGAWEESGTDASRVFRLGPQPVCRGQAFTDPARLDLPSLIIGRTEGQWSTLGKEYLHDLKEFLELDQHNRELATTWCQGAGSPNQEVAMILRRVSERLSYSAVAFGRSARIPRPVQEILKRNQGDCKDHSLLLWQLLRSRGHQAQLALVNSKGGKICAEIPSLDQFDHMVVCVTDDRGDITRVLDATADHQDPALQVPSGLGDAMLLVLDPAGPRLAKAPNHANSSIRSVRRISITPDGRLSVFEQVSLDGYYGGSLRNRFADLSPVDRLDQAQRLYAGSAQSVSAFTLEDLDDPAKPLRFQITWTPRIHLAPGGEGIMGGILPDHWAEWALRIPGEPGRTRTLVNRWPIEIGVTTVLDSPSGWLVQIADSPRDDEDEWYGWKSTSGPSGYQRRVQTKTGTWSAMEFGRFIQRTDLVVDRCALSITMKR